MQLRRVGLFMCFDTTCAAALRHDLRLRGQTSGISSHHFGLVDVHEWDLQISFSRLSRLSPPRYFQADNLPSAIEIQTKKLCRG